MKKNVIFITVGNLDSKRFSTILDGFMFRLDSSRTYEEINAADKEAYSEAVSESKKTYGKLFVKDVVKEIEKKKNSLASNERKYTDLMDEIMSLASTIRSMSIELSCIDIKKITEENEIIAEKDFSNILEIDSVSNVIVSGTCLNVYTNNIYVQHEKNKKWYDIGTFHIKIDMGSQEYNTSTTTRIYNTKYSAQAYENGMNAPHVFRGGNLCHGNLSRGIADCYKNRDVFGVVYQIILFLQTANLDDIAGSKLDRWVEVPADVANGKSSDAKVLYGVRETSAFDDAFIEALKG